MSDVLLLYPDCGIGQPVLWGRFAEGRLTQSGRAGLEDVAAQAGAAEVWFVAPGMDVTLHRVDMPAKSESKARAMLPFLLEDDVANGFAGMHLALGPLADSARLVAAVSSARMESWMDALAAHGLAAVRMAPDYLCIPRMDETQVLAVSGHVIVRLANGLGFAVEGDLARQLLGDAGHMAAPRQTGEAAALEQFFSGMEAAEVDLLQGGYEPRHAFRMNFNAFRRTAVIAGLAAASYMALMLSQAWWYDHQAGILDGEAQAVLRQVFPDTGRVVNAGAQMQARLRELKGGSSSGRFLQLSRLLAGSVDGVGGVTIRNLRYDDGRGELAAEMAYADFEDMEAVKKGIARQGGRIEEGGSRNNGDGMIGDIRVRMQ